MKTSLLNLVNNTMLTNHEKEFKECLLKEIDFSYKACNTMNHIENIPPAFVWDRIEKALDDKTKKNNVVNTHIITSFNLKNTRQAENSFVAAFAVFVIFTGILWKMF